MKSEKHLRQLKDAGRKIVGCFPLYPPMELFYAMDLVPVVLWGFRNARIQTDASDKHLQNYTCSVARYLAEFVLTKGRTFLDGIFMYNACDTLRNMPEILVNEIKNTGHAIPLIRMHLPMAPPGQTDTSDYFNSEINAVIESFTDKLGVSFSSERFQAGIRLYHQMRSLAAHAQQRVAKGQMHFQTFANTLRNGYFMPVEAQIAALEILLGTDAKDNGNPDGRKPVARVILSGILPPPAPVISAIESAGLRIVGNDIASLYRSYADMPEFKPEPYEYYHEFYFHHTPCPTLLFSGGRRLQTLMDMVDKTGAGGVIFVGEKFCEYEYFEYPYLENELRKKGIKTLLLEISMQDDANSSGIRSRIEAFAEMTTS